MSMKIGPETTRGRVLLRAEYDELWKALAVVPRRKLLELKNRLSIAIDTHDQPNGRIIADVSFGLVSRGVESVHGLSFEQVLAKAIALGIDRRLGLIAAARADLDMVVRRAEHVGAMAALAKVMLAEAVQLDRATAETLYAGAERAESTSAAGAESTGAAGAEKAGERA